jgi:hypothetical protein
MSYDMARQFEVCRASNGFEVPILQPGGTAMDDSEARRELISARLLSFGGRGVTGAVDSSTVAYQHLGQRGAHVLPLLERVIEEGAPAGRAYAATLLSELDGHAGRAAWERLVDQSGQVRYYRGCVCEELTLGEYARRSLSTPMPCAK